MGTLDVDQISPDGALLHHVDTKLSEREKSALLLAALPGATVDRYAGVKVVRFEGQVILKKQITHLGFPWPEFKKRIQIPKTWLEVERQATADGLRVRFVGIYHFGDVTIFVDFDPTTYVRRKANNSAAHVATNDLFQAQTLGQFSRTDRNGNRLTSVRHDEFLTYLTSTQGLVKDPRVDVFHRFNALFFDGDQIDALDAVKQMHASSWPDTFQAEWPGFYVEYRLDSFLRSQGLDGLVEYQKVKYKGHFDYDLAIKRDGNLDFYGDLKASDLKAKESPGNDADDIRRCVAEYGRFWYVIYEHQTRHAKDSGNQATMDWNEWRRSVGHKSRGAYNPLSYSTRFKESVRFVKMMILEVNQANFHVVLGDFNQGQQPDGAARALKVMIRKKNIDNFLIYSTDAVGNLDT